ncbi:MAG: TAXI family TRAP transporter solute-binding subunit [Desulfomonilaceae bacterium]|nr:TAXI family TRAP transporter solute-binding subunit [Desulfomonilaceae bacterium]
MYKLLASLLTFPILLLPMETSAAGTRFVSIGTGGVTGVYYPVGGSIAKLLNKKRGVYGLKVTAEATGGSVFNINALGKGDMDLGLAQSDKVTQAWEGSADWTERGPRKELRGICTLQSETVCLIAAVHSGITACSDLRGKIVAVGNPGSGTRDNSLDALATCGLTFRDLGKAEGIKAAEAAGLLQDGRLDAYFYTVGHPNGSIKEAASGRTKVRFVPFTNLGELLKRNPFYSKAVIPIQFYEGAENREDVPTFGVKACLVTTDKVSDEIVYAVTKELFENLDTFRKLHPALEDLDKEAMLTGVPVPIHPGALKYFKEAGLTDHLSKQ